MGLGTLLSDMMEQGKTRRAEWDKLVEQHPGLASTPDDYNAGLQNYIQTGQMPTRTQEARVDTTPQIDSTTPEGVPLTTFPETEVTPPQPIQLDPSFSLDKTTGQAVPLDGVPGKSKVYEYDPTKQDPKLAKLHIISPEGKEIAVYPYKGDHDAVQVMPYSPKDRAGSKNTPMTTADRADLDVLKKYSDAVESGDVNTQLEDMAIGAAGRQGLPVDIEQLQDTVSQPGWFAGMFGAKPEVTPGGRKVKIGVEAGGDSTDGAPAAPATGAGAGGTKPLTADLAKSFLKKAGGDKNKARQLAKTAGYTF